MNSRPLTFFLFASRDKVLTSHICVENTDTTFNICLNFSQNVMIECNTDWLSWQLSQTEIRTMSPDFHHIIPFHWQEIMEDLSFSFLSFFFFFLFRYEDNSEKSTSLSRIFYDENLLRTDQKSTLIVHTMQSLV